MSATLAMVAGTSVFLVLAAIALRRIGRARRERAMSQEQRAAIVGEALARARHRTPW